MDNQLSEGILLWFDSADTLMSLGATSLRPTRWKSIDQCVTKPHGSP